MGIDETVDGKRAANEQAVVEEIKLGLLRNQTYADIARSTGHSLSTVRRYVTKHPELRSVYVNPHIV